jgi:anthranilate synthase component 2
MKILLLDNYDSFTYNLHHLITGFEGVEADVYRNDKIEVSAGEPYDRIVISPGPGIPSEAGITLAMIKRFYATKKILGVCLGMQAIAEVFGARLVNLPRVYHGVATPVLVTSREEALFHGIASPFPAGRYHSWIVDKTSVPSQLIITAEDENGYPMALTHENLLLRGVQFHPESILTDSGKQLMSNWLFGC